MSTLDQSLKGHLHMTLRARATIRKSCVARDLIVRKIIFAAELPKRGGDKNLLTIETSVDLWSDIIAMDHGSLCRTIGPLHSQRFLLASAKGQPREGFSMLHIPIQKLRECPPPGLQCTVWNTSLEFGK